MKKIFRMALVLALAGATLMYTGCTKDYSDDINELKKDVSALQQTVNSLQSAINAGSVITNVQSISNGYKVTLSNGDSFELYNGADGAPGKNGADGANGLNGHSPVVTIGENGNWFIDGEDTGRTATVSEITINEDGFLCIDGESTGIKAGTVAVWDAAAGTVVFKGIGPDGADVAIGQVELTSIVFVPDFYYQGIEATEYVYAKGDAKKFEGDTGALTDDKGTDAKFSKGADGKAYGKLVPVNNGKTYVIGKINVANYKINPSTFDVAKATWDLVGEEDYVNIKAVEKWDAYIVENGVSAKDGEAAVKFKVQNAKLLFADKKVPVMALAGVTAGKTVQSDYEALVPFKEAFKSFAFVKQYQAVNCPDPIIPKTEDHDHLYATARLAVENTYSVPVKYDGGAVNLKELLQIHMAAPNKTVVDSDPSTVDEYVMTIAEAEDLYGLNVNFELVPYVLGANVTEESAYAEIDGSDFYPCYVKHEGNKYVTYRNGTDNSGISSVGRKPVVLVTLTNPNVNEDETLILAQYFKIQISEDVKDPETKTITWPSFGTLPFICNNKTDAEYGFGPYAHMLETVWSETSWYILEDALEITYDKFVATYVPDEAHMYVKNAEGKFVTVEDSAKPALAKDYYGWIYYDPDKVTAVNTKFVWFINEKQEENIYNAGGIQLFKKFTDPSGNVVYIGFDALIADPAKVIFGEPNKSYWFADVDKTVIVDGSDPSVTNKTARNNVQVPVTGLEDVTIFTKDIDDDFVYNTLTLTLADESKAVYDKVWKDMLVKYNYQFSDAQPIFVDMDGNKYQLYTNWWDDNSIIYVASALYKESDGEKAKDALKIDTGKKDDKGKPIYAYPADPAKGEIIATLDVQAQVNKAPASAGELTYLCNTTSKFFINQWDKAEEEVAKMLYFNVDVFASYGNCEIPAGKDNFYVRIIRPLTVKDGDEAELKDGLPGGDNALLGTLLQATDWQGYEVIKKYVATGAADPLKAYDGQYVAGTFKTVGGVTIDWFKYYQFTQITFDLAHIKTDQTGKIDYLKDCKVNGKDVKGVNNAAIVEIWDATNTAVAPDAEGKVTVALSETASTPAGLFLLNELNSHNLHYENNMGIVKDFYLYVPCTITYSWGELPFTAKVKVIKTY